MLSTLLSALYTIFVLILLKIEILDFSIKSKLEISNLRFKYFQKITLQEEQAIHY